MKILGINASPKGSKSRTLALVKAVLDGAKSCGCRTQFVDICNLDIKYCRACDACFKTGKCVRKDDFQGLYKKILAADGLVIGSPNYFMSVTAQLKTVIDRMADAIHCQLLEGKYSVSVATAGGPGQDRLVTDYLNTVMLNFGSFVTGSVGVSIRAGEKSFESAKQKAFKLGEALARDIESGRVYKTQLNAHRETGAYFRDLVMMHKEQWAAEYKYWEKKGWQ
jgi:multimeric flavodoxin WrbA